MMVLIWRLQLLCPAGMKIVHAVINRFDYALTHCIGHHA